MSKNRVTHLIEKLGGRRNRAVQKLAEMAGVHRTQIYRYRREGCIPTRRQQAILRSDLGVALGLTAEDVAGVE